MNKLVKVYSVSFIQYTNCMNDTVRHNDRDMTFIDVGRESFLVKESDLAKVSEYGGGLRDIHFIGNLLIDEND